MSVKFSGSFTRSKGIFSAINKNLGQINLKAVKRVTVTFDPFKENVKNTRYATTSNPFSYNIRHDACYLEN